jgi:hypothetical protein
MKNYYLIAVAMLLVIHSNAQQKLEKLWETDSIINVPESVLTDVGAGILYVSVIGGKPGVKDGIGGVAKLSLDGKVINHDWIIGLNAPIGLGRYGNTLYAADVNEVVVIDIKNAKVLRKIPIEGAQFLNDITVDDKGVVYVADSKTMKIHRLINHMPELYMDSIMGVNGLRAVGDHLFIAAGKNLLKADADKKMIKVAGLPTGGDGLEPIGNGDWLFTSWAGYVYYVYSDGRHDLLLDTHLEKKNTADLGYDPVKKILYIPTFFKKSVAAYQLR